MLVAPQFTPASRRLPIGAEYKPGRDTHFRVWAPKRRRVALVIENDAGVPQSETPLLEEPNGYFSLAAPARPGTRYRFRLDDDPTALPDPASRFQPLGPHGPSEVVDPASFAWTDTEWHGPAADGQVIYELHIGTFTQSGTWRAALDHLPSLVDLGVTVIEMMPVAEFSGSRGWGYDGVDLFAPTHLYGRPDDLRAFVDDAHRLGLAVILDVVYNHLGPDGNYLSQYADEYFTKAYGNEWGEALNFDENAGPIREFFAANAAYWIAEFHFDGLRFDATQQMFDASRVHVLAEVSGAARHAAPHRSVLLVAENEPQDVRALRPPEQGGFGLDALWNDDFHHSALVKVSGFRRAYYTDYRGTAHEFVALAKWGFLYQGQRYSWQKDLRGTPTLGFEPWRFVTFLQNHDQIANAPDGRGERLHVLAAPGLYRALTAAWLLLPGTPMFFQGQEFAASSPFLFFTDHRGELGNAVRLGRAKFMGQFYDPDAVDDLSLVLPDPNAVATFQACRLEQRERETHTAALMLHRDLLRLRREEPAISHVRRATFDAAVLSDTAFVFRYFSVDPRMPRSDASFENDRLVVINFGRDTEFEPVAEPLLAPPWGDPPMKWTLIWSSEDRVYGGTGAPAVDPDAGWTLPAFSAMLFAPTRR